MSKKDLRLFLADLSKEQLEEQVLDLYSRFKDVKVYYDFAFKPNETKLLEEAKLKISKEYNLNVRRPKARRSVAQKLIKHFITLQVNPFVVADLMVFNIEMAQLFSAERRIKQETFYKSMLNSFEQAIDWVVLNELMPEMQTRLEQLADEAAAQRWPNYLGFERMLLKLPHN